MTYADEVAVEYGGDYGSYASCVGANHTLFEVHYTNKNTFDIIDDTTHKFIIEDAIKEVVSGNIHYVELPNKKYAFLDSLTGKIIGTGKMLNKEDFINFTNLSEWRWSHIEEFLKFAPDTISNPQNKEFIDNCRQVLKAELNSHFQWWKANIKRYLPRTQSCSMFSFNSETECKEYIEEVSLAIRKKLIECGFINAKSIDEQTVEEILDIF